MTHRAFSSNLAVVAAVTDSDFWPAFDIIDVDHDGRISYNDLRSFYTAFCHGDKTFAGDENDDVVGSMMAVADTNEDGFVEYEEFERVVFTACKRGGAWESEILKEVFRVMDKDGDGKLNGEDIKSLMGLAGLAVTDGDVEDMIGLGGGDRNDAVSFDGFVRILVGLDCVD